MNTDRNNNSKLSAVALPFLASTIVLFVVLRLIYWSHVSEEPFSDMADYINWGKHWTVGDWMMDGQFWGAYKPPGVPLLYAVVFSITGGYEVDNLRWTQLGITVVALIIFAWQLARESGTIFAGLLLVIVVALSKSSVFWSYKVGTEALSEAFLYLSLATVLWVNRDSASYYKYLILAFVTVFATFVRPNALPLVGVLVLFPLYKQFRVERWRAVRFLVAYAVVVACIWTPWIARNYAYCGQFVPLSTQGPYTFLWELGNVNLPGPDGESMVVHVNQLQEEAPRKFANDCEASHYAMGLVKLWLRENSTVYPHIIVSRLLRYANDRQIDLTKISRTKLYSALDLVLFDKTQKQIVMAAVAMVALSFFFTWARIILAGLAASIFFSALFLGDARLFEPYIPLFLFMTVAPTIPLWQWIQRKRQAVSVRI